MATTRICIGDERFLLSVDTAAEVMRLALTDKPAALALARRSAAAGSSSGVPSGGSVTVPMMLMDSAPVPPPPPVQPRTTTMPTSPMAKVTIGDHTHFVDARVASELDYLRGTVAALTALRDGTVQPPAGQQGTAPLTLDASRDPSTPYGKYCRFLEDASKHRR